MGSHALGDLMRPTADPGTDAHLSVTPEAKSLRRLLGWACVLSVPFVVGELAGAIAGYGALLTALYIHASAVFGLWLARRIAGANRVALAAHVMGFTLLGTTLASKLLSGAGTHVQLLIPVLAVAMVLPYLTGRGLIA